MDAWGPIDLNMAELIEISNEVNEKVCKPIAEQTLEEARALAEEFTVTGGYRDTLRVETDTRTGVDDWAHSRVVSGVRYGHIVEAKHGTLARALGTSE
jgi:hypothetical protein